jgi:hypothetical protein
MQKVEALVKLEAKKSETCGTIQKLLKFSNDSSNCFLCKQAADKNTLKQMSKNFPTESQQVKIDEKIKAAKAEIENDFTIKCESHSSTRVVKLIKEKEESLIKLRDQSQKVD